MPKIVFLSLLMVSTLSHAQGVPSNLQAAIFFKVLAYDRGLQNKGNGDVTIVVITDEKSAGQKDAIATGFSKIEGQKLGSKNVKVVMVSVAGAGDVDAKTSAADVIYVADGSSDAVVKRILQIAVQQKIATLCGSEVLAQQGFAIGLTVEAGKPRIVINLPASQDQGMELSSKVLRLAKVLK